ncbi:MAG: Minf_1886 family protein [Phycisphaerae bacterium]
MKEKLDQIASKDGRYHPKGVRFVYDGLGYTLKNLSAEPQHISGQTLCEGLKELAMDRWGRLSMLVLDNWNIKNTRDFGEIVYLLIENQWMSAQPTDAIEDFNDVFDFHTAFKAGFDF